MKELYTALVAIVTLISCKKDDVPNPPDPHPSMRYIDFENREVKYNQGQVVDLDQDGVKDFTFKVVLIGDPIARTDRFSFMTGSAINAFLVVDNYDNSTRLNKGDSIKLTAPSGYEWYEASVVLLAEKVIPESGPEYWQGGWKEALHHYLPVQVRKNGSTYNGWIELSFDKASDKLILHKAALSLEANKNIKAGS